MTIEEHDTATELESLNELLEQQQRARAKKEAAAPRGFDPACLFLLDLRWENLFEPVGARMTEWRCKGCGDVVRFNKREQHHGAHKRAVAKAGAAAYRDRASAAAAATDEGGESMAATATRTTRSSSRSSRASSANKPAASKPAADTAKVSKTKVAREAAIAVLKNANRPMKMDEIVEKVLANAKVKAADVPKGTVTAQVNFELAEKSPRIVRVQRGVYAIKGAEKKDWPGKENGQAQAKPDPKPSAKKAPAKATA